jgi:hypothetical protein
MLFNWNAQEDVLALAREEAILAGEKARLQLELEEYQQEREQEAERTGIRRRLAITLVQLGIKLDPLAAEELTESED